VTRRGRRWQWRGRLRRHTPPGRNRANWRAARKPRRDRTVNLWPAAYERLVELAELWECTLAQALEVVCGLRAEPRWVLNVPPETQARLSRIAHQRGLTIGQACDLVLGGIVRPALKTCGKSKTVASGEV
jgi:uncharacterized protein YcbK (DUF882 family)